MKKYLVVYNFRTESAEGIGNISIILKNNDSIFTENAIVNVTEYLKKELDTNIVVILNIIPLEG